MRRDALRRLKCDEASLREVNPDIIYCHTRGFDRGPRSDSPGNDQTGCSLAGVTWEDGGGRHGGRPFWSLTSLGDTGNGFLSAIGVIQALYHRARTGRGAGVDTSILNAGLLVASHGGAPTRRDAAAAAPTRRDAARPQPLYRLYGTADGWLCLAAGTEPQWQELRATIGNPEELVGRGRWRRYSGEPSTGTRGLRGVLERCFPRDAARRNGSRCWIPAACPARCHQPALRAGSSKTRR